MAKSIIHEITLCTGKTIYFIDRTKLILKKIVKFLKKHFSNKSSQEVCSVAL